MKKPNRKDNNNENASIVNMFLIIAVICLLIINVIFAIKLDEIEKKIEKSSTGASGNHSETTTVIQAGANVTVQDTGTQADTEANTEVLSGTEQSSEVMTQEETTQALPTESEMASGSETESMEQLPGTGKTVYLTFDDGPSANTSKVLDILDYYGVKATFFVVAPVQDKYAYLYKEIIDRGHTLGIHSYTHDLEEIYTDLASFKEDVTAIRNLVYTHTGYLPFAYRFPGGSSTDVGELDKNEAIRYLKENGMIHFDWNVSAADATSKSLSAEKIVANVFENLGESDESVVLMHDSSARKTTVEALPTIIETLISQGYTIKSIDSETNPVQHRSLE